MKAKRLPSAALLSADLISYVPESALPMRPPIEDWLKELERGAYGQPSSSSAQTGARSTGGAFSGRMLSPEELKALVARLVPDFEGACADLDAYKSARFASLGKKPHAAALDLLLKEANMMAKKPGHTKNVLELVSIVLSESPNELRRTINARDLLEAARWLGLADLRIPCRVLAGGELQSGDLEKFIKPRASVSAEMFRDFELGPDRIKDLIALHRMPAPPRPLGAQYLDLADRIMAMAAKPAFRKDGKVDALAIAEGLIPQDQHFDPAVFNVFMAALGDGVLDRVLTARS